MTRLTPPSRRTVLKLSAATALSAPFVGRAWANTVELNMLGWYGTAEPDMVGAFEAANNVKFVPKYYAGGDNMLAALAQNPPGTFDIIHTDAEYAKLLIANNLVDELDPNAYPMDDLLHDEGCVHGVVLRDGEVLHGDLVVDARGRGSPLW